MWVFTIIILAAKISLPAISILVIFNPCLFALFIPAFSNFYDCNANPSCPANTCSITLLTWVIFDVETKLSMCFSVYKIGSLVS